MRASWLDVPNEFGVRKVDKRGTVRLILADAAIFGALANIITVTKVRICFDVVGGPDRESLTAAQAAMESQSKTDSKWTAFGGAFLAGFLAGGVTHGPRYGFKMGTVLGASFMAARTHTLAPASPSSVHEIGRSFRVRVCTSCGRRTRVHRRRVCGSDLCAPRRHG